MTTKSVEFPTIVVMFHAPYKCERMEKHRSERCHLRNPSSSNTKIRNQNVKCRLRRIYSEIVHRTYWQAIALLLLTSLPHITAAEARKGRKCYSCASVPYERLWQVDDVRNSKPEPLRFHAHCDGRRVEFGTMTKKTCQTNLPCLTIIEQQSLGGMVKRDRPFLFIRGCAEDLLAERPPGAQPTNRPREVEYLLGNRYCEKIPQSEIWPNSVSDASVMVCSCFENDCNIHNDGVYREYEQKTNVAIYSKRETSIRRTAVVMLVCILWIMRI